MRTLILLVIIVLPIKATAGYSVKLDLFGSGVEAIGVRDLNGGGWLAGASKQALSLRRDGREKLVLSLFSAWEADRGNPAYGPSLGIPLGGLGDAVTKAIDSVAPSLADEFGILKKIGNFVSLDFYGGYRFHPVPGSKPWVYGYGGKLKVPLDILGGI